MANTQYNTVLLEKLDAFIRKYYTNQMLRGGIFFAGIFLFSFLLVSVLEYFGHFGTSVRTALFYLFIGVNTWLLVFYIVIPLLKLYRIGKVISYAQAAEIIGRYFPEVSDKLLNTLQLEDQYQNSSENALLRASIDQRIQELKPVPFVNSIRFSENKRFLKYAILPLLLIVFLSAISPDFFKESTVRLVRHTEEFIPQAPFDILIKNGKLEARQNEDFTLTISTKGKVLPGEVFILLGDQRFRMKEDGRNQFSYTFRNLQQSTDFRFFAEDFVVGSHRLNVVPKPLILSFSVDLIYPSYLGKEKEHFDNQGDIQVPEGTKAVWRFRGKHIQQLRMTFGEFAKISAEPNSDSTVFVASAILGKTTPYTLLSTNRFSTYPDSVTYSLNVIPDLPPGIQVKEQPDTAQPQVRFFQGEISDDYGFTRLAMGIRILNSEKDDKAIWKSVTIPVEKSILAQRFYYYLNPEEYGIKAGQILEYRFEVTDNDGFHGPKTSRTAVFRYKEPDAEEQKKAEEGRQQDIQELLKESIRDAQKLQKDAEQMRKKLMDKPSVSWEEKKNLEELLKKQKELEQQLKEAKKRNEESLRQKEKDKQPDPEAEQIMEKQKQLQEMLDKVLNDDLKKLMEEIQKLTEMRMDKDELQKQLDNIKLDNKDVQKELDRMMEFFKQLEFEQKFNQVTDRLDSLAKQQEELSNKDPKSKEEKDALLKEQEKLNKEFQDLKKEMKDLQEKNEKLENPNEMGDMQQDAQDIQEEMENSSGEMKQGNSKSSKQKQKNAAKKMEKMSQKMKDKMASSKKEEAEEDMQSLRLLLQNLVRLSFSQENLIQRLKENSHYSQAYVKIAQDQYKLKEDARLIEDSLMALSKRVIQLQSFINKEMSDVNANMGKTIDALGLRNTPEAKNRQQYVMTSVNNLAVMLTEVMKQMQQQQQQQQGKGSCSKPGKKKSSSGAMSKLQKELNEQMQKMKNGNKPQDGMPKPGQRGSRKNSREFAQMVAKQQAIRKELQRMSEEYSKDAKKAGAKQGLQEMMQQMEQTERDLLNKKLDTETMMRQQDILTRLLESEKAERERDQDEKRESKTGQQDLKTVPPSFEQFKRARQKEMEMYRSVSPAFNPYYKKKVDQYFNQLNRVN